MKLRITVMAACVAACLAPTTALAAANPNNHGHHYHNGWANHHSPPPAPVPVPTPSSGGTNLSNDIAGVSAAVPEAPSAMPPTLSVFQPSGSITTTAAALPLVQNVWLVAILLGSAVAANVALAVWATGRGGHVVLRRALAPVGIRI